MKKDRPYYSSDITWCKCDCANTKCQCHICHLDRLRGTGFYSQADYSGSCVNYQKKARDHRDEA